jgi:hypothetical protein
MFCCEYAILGSRGGEFGQNGDSGAVVVAVDGHVPTGLFFAGGQAGYAQDLEWVWDHMEEQHGSKLTFL